MTSTVEDRTAWLAERRRGIGGSEIHHVFSEPPYGCARRLWLEKRGVQPDYPQNETAVMQRGTRLEELVADLYAEHTGRLVEKRSMIFSATHPWALVNIDREIRAEDRDGPGVLEVKTHNYHAFRRVQHEGLAPAHILQVQHALFVTGYSWGAYAILHPDSWQLLRFDVERDETLVGTIAEAGERFWRMVQHGPMPEPLPEIDRRCKTCPWRRSCRGEALLAAAHIPPEDSKRKLDTDSAFDELLGDYREAERMADEAEATVEAIKDEIRRRLGEREGVQCENGRVYYRPQISMRVDTKALESNYPDLAKQLKRPTKSRPLRIYLT